MELSVTQRSQIFSRALEELLSSGYTFIPIKKVDSYCIDSGVVLEKKGKFYGLLTIKYFKLPIGYEDKRIEQYSQYSVGLYELESDFTPTRELSIRMHYQSGNPLNTLLKEYGTYYSAFFGRDSYGTETRRYYSNLDETEEIVIKRYNRRQWHEYEESRVINTFYLEKTNWKRFRRAVTVESKPNMYVLTNKNGNKLRLDKHSHYGERLERA